jgi:hypothetical protein
MGRTGSACEARSGLHEDCPKHLTRMPERFLTIPSAGGAPRNGRDGDDVALTPLLNLHPKTIHERFLSLESRQGSSARKDALSNLRRNLSKWISPFREGARDWPCIGGGP